MKTNTVLATGNFDFLHPGHIYFLNEARKLGDRLVVIVTHDKTIIKQKGKPAHMPQSERKIVVENLKMVDEVVLGAETNYMQTALDIKPHILALGWDQKIDEEQIKTEFSKYGQNIEVVRIPRLGDHSSGRLKSSIV